MTHTTPQIFATEYKVNFEEDAAAYKALYLKAQADLRAQEEINYALANENRNLREQIEHKIPVIKRGTIDTSKYEPKEDYYQYFGDGSGFVAKLSDDVFFDGSPPPPNFRAFDGTGILSGRCLQEKDEDGYSIWQLNPSFTVSG